MEFFWSKLDLIQAKMDVVKNLGKSQCGIVCRSLSLQFLCNRLLSLLITSRSLKAELFVLSLSPFGDISELTTQRKNVSTTISLGNASPQFCLSDFKCVQLEMCFGHFQHWCDTVLYLINGWNHFIDVFILLGYHSWSFSFWIFAWRKSQVQFDFDDMHATIYQWDPLLLDDISDKVS